MEDTCCLDEDVATMVSGDDTEVGEKGVTISGGQKQRVAMARAVYAKAKAPRFSEPIFLEM